MINRIEDELFYYVRKPYGIPTSFGSQFSFLEDIIEEMGPLFQALEKHFSREEEYGLLNRLDNDTEGFVYFAKNREAKDLYEQLQEKGSLEKIYLCAMQGNVKIETIYRYEGDITKITSSFDGLPDRFQYPQNHVEGFPVKWIGSGVDVQGFEVTYPIMHHIHLEDRMIAVRTPYDAEKGRGNLLNAHTAFYPMYYDDKQDITWCYVSLPKGVRHQIRVHASVMGYPLAGDPLYNKKHRGSRLHLWSLGLLYNR